MIDKSLIVFNFYIKRYCLINVIVKDVVEAPSRGVLEHFVKLAGKYLCQGVFLNKVAGLWK